MSDSSFDFNLNPQDQSNLSAESEPQRFFEQQEQDVVFQKGKAIKSKVMSNPMFISTIKQYGVDAAKTIILQELLKMENEEIFQEIKILGSIAEEDIDIKRSLRASKFMAIQWLEDARRSEEVKNKCQFIIDTIPTFKISGKIIQKPVIKEPSARPEQVISGEISEEPQADYSFELPDMPNRPKPPNNPAEPPVSSSTQVRKLVRGDKIFIMTDIQGDYDRFKNTLLKNNLIFQTEQTGIRWNRNAKTKLVIVGDLFNKSPYSTWGGLVALKAFQVVELIRHLIGQSGENILLCLGNYDLKLASGQLFKDYAYGFAGSYSAIKAQAQALPALINYIEGTAFDTEDNVYSLWEKEFAPGKELFFKLKPDFQIGNRPDIRIRANGMNLPDISSIRNFLQALYKELTLPREKRPKTIKDLDDNAAVFLQPKPGERLDELADSKGRSALFEGILKGTKTISALRRFISPLHKFQTDRLETLIISHVSLQSNIAQMLEKAKEANWKIPEFSEMLNNSKFLKMKRIDPLKFYEDLKTSGFNNIHQFFTMEAEDIYEEIAKRNLLDLFLPAFSPNKLKFGFVKGIERIQEGLKQEDKTGLTGFRLVDRKEEKDFDEEDMKKVADLNISAKQAYADKVITDLFGSNKGFNVKEADEKVLIATRVGWQLDIEIDPNAALYQDQNKSIHVPIKHNVLVSYL